MLGRRTSVDRASRSLDLAAIGSERLNRREVCDGWCE